jgi:hypothetical protein
MSEVRQVQIRGGAVADYTKERKTRRRRQDGGFDVPSPAAQIPITAGNMSRVTNFVRKMSGGGDSDPAPAAPAAAAAPAAPAAPATTNSASAAPASAALSPLLQEGGKPKPKLILEKKKSMKKLHLAPAAVSGKRSVPKTRKIRMNLSGMKKRLTRAKHIHGDSRKKDISEIKRILQDAKLLKPRSSDKPDSPEYDLLLRNTYENYMLLRNRAL